MGNTQALFKLKSTLGIAIASALLPLSSMASPQLEEVVVTAQKREQSLQDVPLSVIAISGEGLEALNRNEISDLSKTIAGFTFQTGSGDAEKAIQIRGVGTSTFSRGVEQSVGTVIDGVVSSSLVASFLDFSDVDRIEVLRGPQGMLFGKNASAGLLNITTSKPTDILTYGASASYADENEIKITGYISGPLSDTLKGRLSVYSNERDGIIDNTFAQAADDSFNDRDEYGIAAKLLFEPTDELSFALNYTYAEREAVCCVRPVEIVVGPFSAALPASPDNDTVFETQSSPPSTTELDVYSLEVNYDLDSGHVLTSITSFTESLSGSNFVTTGLPIPLVLNNLNSIGNDQFTQELRITSPSDQTFTYVGGLYYYKNELDFSLARILDLTTVGRPFYTSYLNKSLVDSESQAIFGQGTWNISETARLSAGLRYNHEEIDLQQTITIAPLPGGAAPPAGVGLFPGAGLGKLNASETDDHVSWRIIAEYDIADNKMIYASVAEGYKGPGANTLETGLASAKPIVDPEIPTSYEIGLKSEWLDGQLRFNASVFHTTFEDFQASLSNNKIPPAFFLANAGELESEGLEFELSYQASDNLFISANVAVIDATFSEFTDAACYPSQTDATGCIGRATAAPGEDGKQDLSGGDLPFSPDVTINLFTRYDIDLESMPFNAYVQGAYHWQDESQLNSSNDPLTVSDSYGIADFAVGIESKESTYSVQLFVKNAFDEFYVSGLTTQGTDFGVLLAHNLEYDYTRRVGIKLSMNF